MPHSVAAGAATEAAADEAKRGERGAESDGGVASHGAAREAALVRPGWGRCRGAGPQLRPVGRVPWAGMEAFVAPIEHLEVQ
jgi:hypothetical protein